MEEWQVQERKKSSIWLLQKRERIAPWIQEDETVLNDGLNPRERSALQGQTGGYQCAGAEGAEDIGRWACPGRRPERRRIKPEREPIVSPDFKVGRGRGLWKRLRKGKETRKSQGRHILEKTKQRFSGGMEVQAGHSDTVHSSWGHQLDPRLCGWCPQSQPPQWPWVYRTQC